MRHQSRDQLAQQVAEYLDRYQQNETWAFTPVEAARHIVDQIVVPFYAGLPGAPVAKLTDAEFREWFTAATGRDPDTNQETS